MASMKINYTNILVAHTALCKASFSLFSGASIAPWQVSHAAASYYAPCKNVDGFFSPTLPDPAASPHDVVRHVCDVEAHSGRQTSVWVTEPDQWQLALQLWQSGFTTVGHLSLMRRSLSSQNRDMTGIAEVVGPATFSEFRHLYRQYYAYVQEQDSDVSYFARDEVLADSAVDAVLLRIGGVSVAGAMAVSIGQLSVIYRVIAMPELRGRGLGRGVMETLLSSLARRGQSEVYLQATVSGRPLYLRTDFTDEAHVSLWQRDQISLGSLAGQ